MLACILTQSKHAFSKDTYINNKRKSLELYMAFSLLNIQLMISGPIQMVLQQDGVKHGATAKSESTFRMGSINSCAYIVHPCRPVVLGSKFLSPVPTAAWILVSR